MRYQNYEGKPKKVNLSAFLLQLFKGILLVGIAKPSGAERLSVALAPRVSYCSNGDARHKGTLIYCSSKHDSVTEWLR